MSYDDSHALIIVLKTFDHYVWDSHNFGSLSGVLGDPESSTFHIRSGSLQKTLHITTVDTNILHQSSRAEVLQTIYLSFTNHKFLPSQTK